MPNWNDLKRPFRDALINAFDNDGLEAILRYHCNQELELLTAKNQSRKKIVDEILIHAERNGWLQKLAEGAKVENSTHQKLQDTTQQILAGIQQQGLAFFQTTQDNDQPFEILDDKLQLYLEWMQRRSSNLPLGPLDQSGRDSEIIGLNDVFVALDVDREGHAQLSDGSDGVYQAALGHLQAQRQLILLGEPGSGKSTLLRYLAFCLCNVLLNPEQRWLSRLSWIIAKKEDDQLSRLLVVRNERETEEQQWRDQGLIPIFIQLRDFARQPFVPEDGMAIWQFVCAQLPPQIQKVSSTLESLAIRNRLFFMFDGVDEVPPAERKKVWQAIGAFLDTPYGGNRWVATCRILSFAESELPRRHLPVVTLSKLNQNQIDRFIES